MDIGSIFLILALLLPVVIFIIRPILERSRIPAPYAVQDLSMLLAERDQVVDSIQELDDDFALGKVPANNYPAQRLSLLQQGAELLRQIDRFQAPAERHPVEDRLGTVNVAPHQTAETNHSSARKNNNAVPPVPDDDLEQRIAARRRAMHGKAGGFCPKCGRPVQVTDHFCPRCGSTLD